MKNWSVTVTCRSMYRLYIGYAFGSYPCNLSKDDDDKDVQMCVIFIHFQLLLLVDGLWSQCLLDSICCKKKHWTGFFFFYRGKHFTYSVLGCIHNFQVLTPYEGLVLVENNGQSSGPNVENIRLHIDTYLLHQVGISCRDLHIGNDGWWGRFKFRGPAQITCSYPTGLTWRECAGRYLTLGRVEYGVLRTS